MISFEIAQLMFCKLLPRIRMEYEIVKPYKLYLHDLRVLFQIHG